MKGTGTPQVFHYRLLVGPHALHALGQSEEIIKRIGTPQAFHYGLLVGPHALHALEQSDENKKDWHSSCYL